MPSVIVYHESPDKKNDNHTAKGSFTINDQVDRPPRCPSRNAYTAPDDHIEPMINRFEPAYDKEVDDRTVFVGNLDTRIGHNEVRAFFGGQGLVKRVDVKKGLTRAVANVEMRHPGDLPRVLRHNGVRLNGRILSVYPKVFHVRRQTEEPHRILGDALAGLRRLAN